MRSLHVSNQALAALAERASRFALDYWSSLEARPAFPLTGAEHTRRLFEQPWAQEGLGPAVLDDFRVIAEHSRPSTGRFFGYVFGSGEPVGAIAEWLAAALNQNVTAWRSAPAAVSIERTVVGWLADALGCDGMSGSLCGGGSSANLMALAMAREALCPANEHGARPCAVYASREVHMSIPKAAALLGIGRANLRLIETDTRQRLRPDVLQTAIAADLAAGLKPLAVVATAGTVNTGAIDPLPEIARIAADHGLWMHVDGAYGALAALAVPERFAGLSLADSLSLDAHKWLYQPVECGCLLFRSTEAARRAFVCSGEYAQTFTVDPVEGFAFFDESLELSRRFRALKLWLSLRYHGRDAYREAINQDLVHARRLAERIEAHAELELLAPVNLSAVCFRHRERRNEALLQRVNQRGRVFLSNARLDGQFALRACFVNHRTTEADVDLIVDEVIAAAGEME